jgi:hypothetical protein
VSPHENRRVGVNGSAETFRTGRRPESSVKNWVLAADELPGVPEGDMSIEDANESTEPVVGRLGGDAQRGHLV